MHVRPEIRDLYNILEVEFHPLSICRKIEPVIAVIAQDPDMLPYIKPLHQVILTRLFQQLSQVYESLRLDFVLDLASFPPEFELDRSEIEKFIMSACKKGELSIRIDHANRILSFESDVFISSRAVSDLSVRLQATPSDLVRSQLSRLSKCLYQTIYKVDAASIENESKQSSTARQRALAGAEKEHQDSLARRAIIERRRELVEIIALREERELASKRAQKQLQEAEIEQRRQAEELRKKDLARKEREKEIIKMEEAKKLAEELVAKGVKIDPKVNPFIFCDLLMQDLVDLDTEGLRRLQLHQLDKERGELYERLRVTGKRIDHFERALRREEIPLLNKDYELQLATELRIYEKNRQQKLALAAARHQESVKLKRRLRRILPDYEAYRELIKAKQSEEFKKREQEAFNSLEAEKAHRQAAYQRYLDEERRIQEEQRKLEELEMERLHKEEAERREKAEAAEREAAEKARAREEHLKYISILQTSLINRRQNEIAERQREREREAEENMARRRQQSAATPSSPGLKPSANAWRATRNRGESEYPSGPAETESRAPRNTGRWGGSTREQGNTNTSESKASQSRAPGKYIPPAARRG
jgi:translation initiation factor 3 subunit A